MGPEQTLSSLGSQVTPAPACSSFTPGSAGSGSAGLAGAGRSQFPTSGGSKTFTQTHRGGTGSQAGPGPGVPQGRLFLHRDGGSEPGWAPFPRGPGYGRAGGRFPGRALRGSPGPVQSRGSPGAAQRPFLGGNGSVRYRAGGRSSGRSVMKRLGLLGLLGAMLLGVSGAGAEGGQGAALLLFPPL